MLLFINGVLCKACLHLWGLGSWSWKGSTSSAVLKFRILESLQAAQLKKPELSIKLVKNPHEQHPQPGVSHCPSILLHQWMEIRFYKYSWLTKGEKFFKLGRKLFTDFIFKRMCIYLNLILEDTHRAAWPSRLPTSHTIHELPEYRIRNSRPGAVWCSNQPCMVAALKNILS